MENNKTILYVLGALLVIVVLYFLMKKSGATVIQGNAPATNSGITGDQQVALALAQQNASVFGAVAQAAFGAENAKTNAQLGLAQIGAVRDVGLAQANASVLGVQNQNTVQLAAINAARDVGLAQAGADATRTQQQNAALRSVLNSQTTNQALQGLLSNVGNILRTLGGNTSSSAPKSSGSSGAGGTSPSSSAPSISRNVKPPKLNPSLPVLNGSFWDLGTLPGEGDMPGGSDYSPPDFWPSDFRDAPGLTYNDPATYSVDVSATVLPPYDPSVFDPGGLFDPKSGDVNLPDYWDPTSWDTPEGGGGYENP